MTLSERFPSSLELCNFTAASVTEEAGNKWLCRCSFLLPNSAFFADMIVTYRASTLGFGRRLLLFSVELQQLAHTMMFCTPYNAESDEFGRAASEFDLWSVRLRSFRW
jgi:hypothetical protein